MTIIARNHINTLKLNTCLLIPIRLLIKNFGSLVHEFNIATKKMHFEHNSEMMKMIENEILLGDRIYYEKMKEVA